MPKPARLDLPLLAAIVFVAQVDAASIAASPQGLPWPCEGWTVESGTPAYSGQDGSVVAGDVVARMQRYITSATSQFLDATLELHRFDSQRDRYVLSDTVTFPEWRELRGLDGLCSSGRTLALQPWFLGHSPDRCDIVELGPLGATLSTVPLSGYRLFAGRLTAVVGDTVFAVDCDGGPAIRLSVIEKDAAGVWAVQQVVQAWGVRLMYPPKETVWVSASEGRVVVAASRLLPFDFSAVTFERTPSGQWIHAGMLDRPVVGEFQRLSNVTGLALDGDRAVLTFQDWGPHPIVTAWLYERVGIGAWQVTQAFDGPDLAPTVALGAGRLALTRGTTTELYERGAGGSFDVVRRFHGLERVFHLDDLRIAGLTATGAGVRVVPLGASGTGDVQVCEERGVVVCEPDDPLAPRLRVFFEFTPWPAAIPRLVAGVEQAPPGALAVALRGPDIGWNPAAGGALCIDGSTATRGVPALVDATGRAAVEFDVSGETLESLLQLPLYVQALVVGSGVAQATNAVRVIL